MSVIRLDRLSMADAEHAVAQIWRILEEQRVASPRMTVAVNEAREGVDLSLTFHAAHDAAFVGRAMAASGLLPIVELEIAARARSRGTRSRGRYDGLPLLIARLLRFNPIGS